jgi:hypothetical protein
MWYRILFIIFSATVVPAPRLIKIGADKDEIFMFNHGWDVSFLNY